jgi:hypothetical protein
MTLFFHGFEVVVSWRDLPAVQTDQNDSSDGMRSFGNTHLNRSFDDFQLLWSHHHCPFRSESPLGGILSHLAAEAGGNFHDPELISAFSDSAFSSSSEPRNVADLPASSHLFSPKTPNPSLGYDFKGGLNSKRFDGSTNVAALRCTIFHWIY